jgi:hypothetical protein
MSTPQLDTPWAGQTFAPALPLDIKSIERALLLHVQQMAALGGPLQQVAIDHFPDKPESYRLTHRVGALLLIYAGSEPTPTPGPMSVDEVRQERELLWDFAVVMRDLGWAYGGQPSGTSPGAYDVLDGLRLAVTGYQHPGCTKMVWRGDHFVRRDSEGGVWYYQARFAHRSVVINVTPDIAYPTWAGPPSLDTGGLTRIDVPDTLYTFDADGEIQLPDLLQITNVRVSNDVGAVYVLGTDYAVDEGLITAIPGGDLAAGAEVFVSFSHQGTPPAGDYLHGVESRQN